MEDKKKVIMLIEDNPIDRMVFEKAVQKIDQSYIIHHHESVEAAQNYFQYANGSACYPFLIFLDLRLKGLSGLEFLRYRLSSEKLKKIPTLVFSTSQNQTDVSSSLLLGAGGYFVKPLKFEDLIELLTKITGYWKSSIAPF